MIDPQLQANAWIKETAGKANIKILRQNMNPNEITFIMESAIQNGTAILLENVTEEIDHAFDNVIF